MTQAPTRIAHQSATAAAGRERHSIARTLALGALLAVVGGCGFQLQGTGILPRSGRNHLP